MAVAALTKGRIHRSPRARQNRCITSLFSENKKPSNEVACLDRTLWPLPLPDARRASRFAQAMDDATSERRFGWMTRAHQSLNVAPLSEDKNAARLLANPTFHLIDHDGANV